MTKINYPNNLIVGCASKRTTIVATEIRTPKGSPKLYLKTKSTDGKPYTINEVWIKSYNGKRTTRGLWLDTDVNDQIRRGSELHRLLESLGANSVADLVNKEITVEPKENGFMCIVLE
jgi:hypothetical protein